MGKRELLKNLLNATPQSVCLRAEILSQGPFVRVVGYPYIRQIAVLLGMVQSVAHDELVGDLEPGVPALELSRAPAGLAEQGDHLEAGRIAGLEAPRKVLQASALSR